MVYGMQEFEECKTMLDTLEIFVDHVETPKDGIKNGRNSLK
jgi:hypothetical protein